MENQFNINLMLRISDHAKQMMHTQEQDSPKMVGGRKSDFNSYPHEGGQLIKKQHYKSNTNDRTRTSLAVKNFLKTGSAFSSTSPKKTF